MNIVDRFKVHYHWRIVYQLIKDPVSNTFACFVGVMNEDEKHWSFEPQRYGGDGQEIPDSRKEKVSYAEVRHQFEDRITELELDGYAYRS